MARLLLCLALLLVLGYVCAYRDCTPGEYICCEGQFCTLKSEKSYFEVDPWGARLYLVDGDRNPRKDLSSLGIGFSHLIEREKNLSEPVVKNQCRTASSQDPTLNYEEGKNGTVYFGAIRQIFTFSEMVTFVYLKPDYPHPGIHTVEYEAYDGPTPILSVIYSLSLIEHEIILSNDTTYTDGVIPLAHYKPHTLKLSLSFPNFPWEPPVTGQEMPESFVTVYCNITFQANPNGNDSVTVGFDSGAFGRVENVLDGYAMEYSLDPFYLIDGVPYEANKGKNETETLPFVPPYLQIYSNLDICKGTFDHWGDLLYDPSIGVLFSNFPTTAQPESEAAVKGRKASLLAVYIIVPIVVVGLAATVLLILFVPPIYNALLPSDPLKRNGMKAARNVDADAPRKTASKATPVPTRTEPTTNVAHTAQSPASAPASQSWTTVQKPPRV